MARGDQAAEGPWQPDGIGPEDWDGVLPGEDFAPRCPHCGRLLPLSDEGVIV